MENAAQQQKYIAQMPVQTRIAQPQQIQYIQQPHFQQMQMQGVPHPQITGQIYANQTGIVPASMPYQQVILVRLYFLTFIF
jgi:hypothetical protein